MTHIVVPQDILIRHIGEHNITPYETLQQAADPSHCIHIAYIAEGYTEAEMPTFIKDCRIAMEALFAHEPFKSLRSRFNIVAVKAPSVDSGIIRTIKGYMEEHGSSLSFRHFLQRQIPHYTPSQRPP